MRILLFVAMFVSFCFAGVVEINHNITYIDTTKQSVFVEDKNNTLTASDILDNKYLSKYGKASVGYPKSAFWSKVVIHNNDAQDVTVIFKNRRAGIDKIDVSVFDGKRLIYTQLLGDMRDQNLRLLAGTNSAFYLHLQPNQELTVVTRFENIGSLQMTWDIYAPKNYAEQNSWNLLFYGLFGGIILALIIYNLNMFFSLKDISYVFYIGHAFFMLWFQYGFNGVTYFMDLGIDLRFLSMSTYFAPNLVIAFLMLFMINIFRLRERGNKAFLLLSSLSATNLILFILTFLQTFNLAIVDLIKYQYIVHAIWIISMCAIIMFIIYAYAKNYRYAVYFLIGEGVYLSSALFVLLISTSPTFHQDTGSYMVSIGMLCEIIFSSMALSKRVREINENNITKDRLMAEEAKFASVGRSIGNVTHQWKEPLTRLNAYIVYMQALYYSGNKEKLLSEFDENITKSAEAIEYMKGSIDELYYFYSGERAEAIDVKKKIELAYKLQQDRLIPNNISVEIECDEGMLLQGGKHALANTLMILFDNSIYQLVSTHRTDPKIKIKVVNEESNVVIYFEDNGGGIQTKPIEKIFDINYSTKANKGSGLGLSLAKKLIEEHLLGNLFVANTQDGALFRITLPKRRG